MSPGQRQRRGLVFRFPQITAACLLLLARCPTAAAQTAGAENAPVVSVGAFLLGATMSVYTHELGHLMSYHLVGATSAQMTFWPPATSARFPNDASTFQKSFPALMGPLATRLLSEGVDDLLDNTSPPAWLNTVGGAYYLAMRFDLPFQVLTSSLSRLVNPNGSHRDDMSQGFVEPWFKSPGARNLAYVLLVATQVVDLYLDIDQIVDNYRRLTGQPPPGKSTAAGTIHWFPNKRGITMSYVITL